MRDARLRILREQAKRDAVGVIGMAYAHVVERRFGATVVRPGVPIMEIRESSHFSKRTARRVCAEWNAVLVVAKAQAEHDPFVFAMRLAAAVDPNDTNNELRAALTDFVALRATEDPE